MTRIAVILTIVCCTPFLAHGLEINIGSGNKVHTGEIATDGCDEGNGKVKEEKRAVDQFTGIKVEGAFDVELVCGKPSVLVTADSNIINKIITRVEDGVLYIHSSGSICTQNPLKIWASSPSLNSLDVSGSSEVAMACGVGLEKMSLQLSEASEVTARGTVDQLVIEMTDASEFHGYDFKAQSVRINASGSGEAQVWASREISGISQDASTVNYRGNPKTVRAKAVDAGDFAADG